MGSAPHHPASRGAAPNRSAYPEAVTPRPPHAVDPASGAFTPDQRRILTALLMPLFLSLMSVSVVNVALPAIESGLGATSSDLQWVLAGYTLTFGMVLVAAGRAGDLWGRKSLFLAGIGIYVLGSIVSGLAVDPLMLNAGRLLTGVGAGVFSPQAIGFIQANFTGRARGRAYGLFGTVVGLGVAVGPMLGGLLLGALGPEWGWRSTFLMSAPVGLAAIAMGALWLPPPTRVHGLPSAPGPRGIAALDPVGALLLGAGAVSLMVPFIVPGAGWLLALAAALLAAWWLWERRMKARAAVTGVEPMVDPALFRRTSFTLGALESTIYLATMPAVFAIVAIFLQQGMGFTALQAGLVGLPGAAVVATLSPWVGSKVQRHGPRLVLIGALLGLASLGVLVLAFERSAAGAWSPWVVGLGLIVQSASQAFLLTSTQVLMMDDVAGHEAGAAGGVAQTAQRMGTALGLSVVTGAFFAALAGAASRADGPPSAPEYAHAASAAMGMVAVCWALTAVIAGLDVVRRRRAARAA